MSPDHGSLAAILDAAPDAFISIGVDGRVLLWNRACEALFGWSADEARGRHLGELIVPPDTREAHGRGVERFAQTGHGRLEGQPVELMGMHRDGHEVAVELTINAARDESGAVVSFHAFLRDASEQRAQRAGELAQAGVVDAADAVIALDATGRVTAWNPGAEHLYGYRPEEVVGATLERLRAPDEADVAETVAGALDSGDVVSGFETRQRRRDGSVADVSVAVLPLPGGDGVTVVARDISQAQDAERSMRRYRSLVDRSFENAPIGMSLVDPDGTVLAANPALLRLLGVDREGLLATPYTQFLHPDDRDRVAAELTDVVVSRQSEREVQGRVTVEGGERWLAMRVAVVDDQDGRPEILVAQMQDVTALKEAERELRAYSDHLSNLSVRDQLTGLPNQGGFEQELASRARHGGRWSLVTFDIDGFRRLNALRGLGEGDATLRHVARALTELSRESDAVARIGADEFALVLDRTGEDGARRAAERVSALVAEHADGVTLSVGVAEFGRHGTTPAALMAATATELANSRRPPSGTDDAGLAEDLANILDLAREQLGIAVACIARVDAHTQSFEAVSGDTRSMGFDIHTQIGRSGAMIADVAEGRLPQLVPDADAEPSLAEHRAAGRSRSGAYVAVPLESLPGEDTLMLCCIHPVARPELGERELSLVRFLARIISGRRATARARRERRQAQVEMAGVHALLSALGARDHYTGEHSNAVVALATEVGRRLGLGAAQLHEVEQVALLHDIGKVGIPDAVLQKRGPLTEQEWELMRQHPAIGSRIVSSTPPLSHLAPAVRAEHERWDGGGYPDGLAGEQIPRSSRIVFACDAFHAMTSDRPYREAMAPEDAVAELREHAGSQFDPDVVEALLMVVRQVEPRPA